MNQKLQNLLQARKVVTQAADQLASDETQHEKLVNHLWQLDNEYAIEMAEMLLAHVLRGEKPDFQGSRVMALWFRKAMAIIKRV